MECNPETGNNQVQLCSRLPRCCFQSISCHTWSLYPCCPSSQIWLISRTQQGKWRGWPRDPGLNVSICSHTVTQPPPAHWRSYFDWEDLQDQETSTPVSDPLSGAGGGRKEKRLQENWTKHLTSHTKSGNGDYVYSWLNKSINHFKKRPPGAEVVAQW